MPVVAKNYNVIVSSETAGLTAQYTAILAASTAAQAAADAAALSAEEAAQAAVQSFATPFAFGAVCDGVTDDTQSIIALHEYCNAANIRPDYSGVRTFAIDANAQVPINTSVDFGGALIRLVNGIVATPAFGTENTAFLISDPLTPVVTGTVTPTAGNMVAGSVTPTADFFDGPGFVYLQCDAADPGAVYVADRDKTGTLTYRQSFAVVKDGQSVHPLAVNLSGCASFWRIERPNSQRGFLTVENATINPLDFNNQWFFKVERNQVKLQGHAITPSTMPSTLPQSINAIMKIYRSSEVMLRDITSPAQTSYDNGGTYLLNAETCAEITVDNVTLFNGWGSMGTREISGLYVRGCKLNRIDTHQGGFNLFVNDCVLQEHGVQIGWGGGMLSVADTTFINCHAVSSRPDYGNYWFGNFVFNNLLMDCQTASEVRVLDFATDRIGVTAAAIDTLPLPELISITNVTRTRYRAAGDCRIVPIAIRTLSGAENKVVPPMSIVISNVSCSAHNNWNMINYFDIQNMRTQSRRVEVRVSNVPANVSISTADFTAGDTSFRLYTKIQAQASPTLQAKFSNCDNLCVDVSNSSDAPRIEALGCSQIRRFYGGNAGRTIVLGGTLDGPLIPSGDTKGKVGQTGGTGSLNIAALIGCEVTGAWDLSNVNRLIGNGWSSAQDANITLPGGVTWASQAAGWRG